jgi:hypothetical protein
MSELEKPIQMMIDATNNGDSETFLTKFGTWSELPRGRSRRGTGAP